MHVVFDGRRRESEVRRRESEVENFPPGRTFLMVMATFFKKMFISHHLIPQLSIQDESLHSREPTTLRSKGDSRPYVPARHYVFQGTMGDSIQATPNVGTSEQSSLSSSSTRVQSEKRKFAGSDGNVDWGDQSRQWDVRINLGPGDCTLESAERELEWSIQRIKNWDNIRYVFVGGIEVGDNPSQDDFKRHHVHIALILRSPTTRRSVVHHLGLSKYSNGLERSYYLGKRNPFASFTGWRNHHSKDRTKVGKELVAYEAGEAPKEYGNQLLKRGEAGKMKQDDMLREIMQLFSQGKKDQAFQDFPALTLRYHAQITALVKSRVTPPEKIDHSKRLWIFGPPGTGKSAYVAWKYPKAFKKSLAKNEVLYWNGTEDSSYCIYYLLMSLLYTRFGSRLS